MSTPSSQRLPPGFDPRTVPVLAVDAHLAPVPSGALAPARLRERFARSPAWTPEVVREPGFADRAPVPAAVLMGLRVGADPAQPPAVLLTQRTAHLSSHAGQVAFPGGRIDADDADAVAAALREAQEEVGLAPERVQVLGQLPVYVTGTGYAVTPVVALVDAQARLQANPQEVADVFEVPLDFLMNPAHHRHHEVNWNGVHRHWLSMPYLEPHGLQRRERFIWGATAAMLRNFYRFLQA